MDNASNNNIYLDILALKYSLNKAYRGMRCVDYNVFHGCMQHQIHIITIKTQITAPEPE